MKRLLATAGRRLSTKRWLGATSPFFPRASKPAQMVRAKVLSRLVRSVRSSAGPRNAGRRRTRSRSVFEDCSAIWKRTGRSDARRSLVGCSGEHSATDYPSWVAPVGGKSYESVAGGTNDLRSSDGLAFAKNAGAGCVAGKGGAVVRLSGSCRGTTCTTGAMMSSGS